MNILKNGMLLLSIIVVAGQTAIAAPAKSTAVAVPTITQVPAVETPITCPASTPISENGLDASVATTTSMAGDFCAGAFPVSSSNIAVGLQGFCTLGYTTASEANGDCEAYCKSPCTGDIYINQLCQSNSTLKLAVDACMKGCKANKPAASNALSGAKPVAAF